MLAQSRAYTQHTTHTTHSTPVGGELRVGSITRLHTTHTTHTTHSTPVGGELRAGSITRLHTTHNTQHTPIVRELHTNQELWVNTTIQSLPKIEHT